MQKKALTFRSSTDNNLYFYVPEGFSINYVNVWETQNKITNE